MINNKNAINIKQNSISDQTRETLKQFFDGLPGKQIELIDHVKDKILSNISTYTKMTDFQRPVRKVEKIFLRHTASYSAGEQLLLKRALLAELALNLPNIVATMNLPVNILNIYPRAFDILTNFLKTLPHKSEQYDSMNEYFCKDVRFVLGLSIPTGARIVDMNSRITPQSMVLSLIRSKNIMNLSHYIRAGGMGRWFRGHIDSRYITEFNEAGNDDHYHRVAELLLSREDIKGLVITSWYYDPHILEISPQLAYLRMRVLERGAFFLQHGADQKDIENAIKKSPTRRRLYLNGKYKPTCYSMIWPRKKLIAWKNSRGYKSHD